MKMTDYEQRKMKNPFKTKSDLSALKAGTDTSHPQSNDLPSLNDNIISTDKELEDSLIKLKLRSPKIGLAPDMATMVRETTDFKAKAVLVEHFKQLILSGKTSFGVINDLPDDRELNIATFRLYKELRRYGIDQNMFYRWIEDSIFTSTGTGISIPDDAVYFTTMRNALIDSDPSPKPVNYPPPSDPDSISSVTE